MLHCKIKNYRFTKYELFWKGASTILTINLIKFHRASVLRIMRSNCLQCETFRKKSVKKIKCSKFRLSFSQNYSDLFQVLFVCCLIVYVLRSKCECYKNCLKSTFVDVLSWMKTFYTRSCLFSVIKTFYSTWMDLNI